jgi:adenylate cyclase
MQQFRIGLVAIFILVVAAITVVTVIAGYYLTGRTKENIENTLQDQIALATDAASTRVKAHFTPAIYVLDEINMLIERGFLPIWGKEQLGSYFTERLRQMPDLGWIGLGLVDDDSFIGATRDPQGRLVLNRSSRSIQDGVPREWIVTEDSQLLPLTDNPKPAYLPSTRDWFTKGLATDGIRITEPYVFNEGRIGITVTKRVWPSFLQKPAGVLTADFFLNELAETLGQIAPGEGAAVYVVNPEGSVLVTGVNGNVAAPELPREELLNAFRKAKLKPWSAPVDFDANLLGQDYHVAFRSLSMSRGVEWGVVFAFPTAQLRQVVLEQQNIVMLTAFITFSLAVVASMALGLKIGTAISAFRSQFEKIAALRPSPDPAKGSRIREIQGLADSINAMKSAIATFTRYVPRDVARDLLSGGRSGGMGGVTRIITVLNCDLQGFTTFAERHDPNESCAILNSYFERVTAAVHSEGGIVDKFMGDGVLALFNATTDLDDHAGAACRSAVRIAEAMAEPLLAGKAETKFPVRVGLETGRAVVGNVGTEERLAFTAIGDVVNTASRLQESASHYGAVILASERVRNRSRGFSWRYVTRATLRGRHEETALFELLGQEAAFFWERQEMKQSAVQGQPAAE